MELQNQTSEVKRALQEKVPLDDGRVGFVFTELVQIGPSNRWYCHVCQRTVDSERALVMHLSHPYHTIKLRFCQHPAKNFKKFADCDVGKGGNSSRKERSPHKPEGTQSSWEMTTDVLPGEPVPPGMEDVVEGVCQIQSTFDEHPGPLIGLEYIVELVTSEEESEPKYICLLCEKKGDPRTCLVHVTSQSHCLKYISCFFRTVGNTLNMIPRTVENKKSVRIAIMKVTQEIEKNYGRLKPTSAVAETFAIKKYEILRQIDEKEHFRETPATAFANLVSTESLKKYADQDEREALAVPEKNKNKPVLPSNQGAKTEKPVIKPVEKGSPKEINKAKPVSFTDKYSGKEFSDKFPGKDMTGGDNDPIEVTSSLSSVSSSLGSDDGRDRKIRSLRDPSRERYQKKVRMPTPELDDHRKYLYNRSIRRGVSPPFRRSRGSSRSRTRSRSRDRRAPEYYRDRDRVRRSPSYDRSRRPSRSRFEGRYSEDKYRRKSPNRGRYGRPRDRKRRDSLERHDRDRSLERRDRSRSQGRSLERRDRSRSLNRKLERRDRSRSLEKQKDNDSKWDKYRAELHKLEVLLDNKLKYFEERPEKHPRYSEEWKGFWNKRYKEIQLSGKDPTNYDFKPEWIIYWAEKMKELSEEEFNKERDALKKKMNVDDKPEKPPSSDLQDISPPTPESQKDVTVDDIKNTWKALTGSEITAPKNNQEKSQKRSPSPWEGTSSSSATMVSSANSQVLAADAGRSISSRKPYDIAPPILHCLRMLSVLEHQLGSLGPKVMDLLSKALVLERGKYNSSMTLLKDVNVHIFFETVKEKIRGQLIAGIVNRALVSSSRSIIKAIESMLDTNPASSKESPIAAAPARLPLPPTLPVSEPVQVPGIGMIDKMAVAQQIASALIAQGKTDVTQEELEHLINAVVGIAKASNANVSTNISSDAFFSQLNIENSTATSHINEILSNMISSAQKSLGMESKHSESKEVPNSNQPETQEKKSSIQSNLSGQRGSQNEIHVANDTTKDSTEISSNVQSIIPNISKDVSDEELKEKLMKFSMLPREDQQNLIALLKELETTQATRVENLRKYVSIGLVRMSPDINKKEESKDGRLSPFSSRIGVANPAPDDSQNGKQKGHLTPVKEEDDDDDDDDDDYSVEDVYKAASEKLFKKNENSKMNFGSGLLLKRDSPEKNKFGIQSISTVSSRSAPDSSNKNKGIPILSGQRGNNKPALLPTPRQDRNSRSNISVVDNTYQRNDTYQINLANTASSQNETGNNNFAGTSYKSYEEPFQRNPEQYSENNFYTSMGTDKVPEFQENTYNDYNSRIPTGYGFPNQPPQQQSFDNQQPPPWQYGSHPTFNRDSNNDQFKDNPGKQPLNYQQDRGYHRNTQNNQTHFGGYRSNF